MTPPGIEPVTFRLAMQCLNQRYLRTGEKTLIIFLLKFIKSSLPTFRDFAMKY
jgi:hypothetical protein